MATAFSNVTPSSVAECVSNTTLARIGAVDTVPGIRVTVTVTGPWASRLVNPSWASDCPPSQTPMNDNTNAVRIKNARIPGLLPESMLRDLPARHEPGPSRGRRPRLWEGERADRTSTDDIRPAGRR